MTAPAARPVTTPLQALRLVRASGMVTLVHTPGVRSLVEAVAGEPVRGTWWAHPKGGAIFRLAGALEGSDEVLVAKLVAGKVTFVHASLWPALHRVVSDPGWRAKAIAGLDPAARALLARVDAGGAVRSAPGQSKAERDARVALEKSMLVRSVEVHTESGAHATELRSWRSWADALPRADLLEASALSLEEALALLRARAGGAPLSLEVRGPPRSRARR